MDAIVNVVAEVLLLGSLALLVWGAILTAGQLIRSGRRAARQTRPGAAARTAGTPRPGVASARRRRFSRLAPPA